MRRGLFVVGLGIAILAGWQVVETVWYHAEVARAGREAASGRFALARVRLLKLASRSPGRVEVELLLGDCEAALGNIGSALAAWGRVPLDSPEALSANLRAARLALEHGRFAVAEWALARAARAPDDLGDEARTLRDQLSLYTGRLDEIRDRLRRDWARGKGNAETLRKLWLLDTEVLPVDAIRDVLEKAGRDAPDDDRVWLGRANLATRAGRFTEADAWLKRCLSQRPGDVDVWRARLDWALASDHLDVAEQALVHLPAYSFSQSFILDLRARFAARQGETGLELAALEELLEREPANAPALERLAELTSKAGDAGRATDLRRRKADVDRARDRYRKLLSGDEENTDLRALALTAEALSRPLEAKGWWNFWAQQGGDADEARAAVARLVQDPSSRPATGWTLADVSADVLKGNSAKQPDEPKGLNIPRFNDEAKAAGLRFVYDNGRTPLRQLPETMGGGVGLIDYDGDGLLDVYAVQGGIFPPDPEHPNTGDRLFRNRGDGTFEDVSDRAGIARMPRGYGHGVTVGDYDNDGHPDLFVTRWRSYALYRNRGDGTFKDVTAAAGLGGNRDWPTSAAFADLDNDGDLDLYVCHYLAWDPERSGPCQDAQTGKHVYCIPKGFDALPDHVFRNDSGKFIDVTNEAGFEEHEGRGLGVVAADIDDDGNVDLFVANDMSANYLFKNQGGFRFREEGVEAGVATNASGGYQAGMGVAAGDLDGDGLVDLAVANFYGESTTFFRNLGRGQFADHTGAAGLAAPSRFLLGFGLAFLDANDDGQLDVASANGHVNDFSPAIPYAMPAQLLLGVGKGRLIDVSDRAGPSWGVARVGRGLAYGDLDNDGRVDLLILAQNGPLAYLHNVRTAPDGHSLTLRLQGTASNRDAVGARLTLTAGGRRQVAQRYGGGSYVSANDGRIHFGLGTSTKVESVEVRWPSGKVDLYRDLDADAAYLLREGDPNVRPLSGWKSAR